MQAIKTAGAKAKKSAKSYKRDIVDAHDIGYALGWDYAFDIPDRFLAKTVAAYGFRKGMCNKRRIDKYNKTYQKKGTNF
jgi:hypothetical protein